MIHLNSMESSLEYLEVLGLVLDPGVRLTRFTSGCTNGNV